MGHLGEKNKNKIQSFLDQTDNSPFLQLFHIYFLCLFSMPGLGWNQRYNCR